MLRRNANILDIFDSGGATVAIAIKEVVPGLFAPTIFCDHCGEPITVKDGLYVYGLEANTNQTTEIRYYHRLRDYYPACAAACDLYEQELDRRGYMQQWDTIDSFAKFLTQEAMVRFPGANDGKPTEQVGRL